MSDQSSKDGVPSGTGRHSFVQLETHPLQGIVSVIEPEHPAAAAGVQDRRVCLRFRHFVPPSRAEQEHSGDGSTVHTDL